MGGWLHLSCYSTPLIWHHLLYLQERAAKAEDTAEVNSKTFRVKRKVSGGSPLKAARRSWATTRCMRGAFYFEGDSIISHQYNLDVRSDGVYNISIKVQWVEHSKIRVEIAQLFDQV